MKFKWEKIGETYTSRAKVIGGWIVSHLPRKNQDLFDEGEPIGIGMVFIPDPKHIWEIDND